MADPKTQDEQFKYSKMLSSLFCSTSIIALSILSLLNNLSLDIYSATMLLKTVIPASACFWFIGYVIGTILDKNNVKIIKEQIKKETEAYEIPSMFASSEVIEDEFGAIWSNYLKNLLILN